MTLAKLYRDRDWQGFADLFLKLHTEADDMGKLKLLRALLCEYRRREVLILIVGTLSLSLS